MGENPDHDREEVPGRRSRRNDEGTILAAAEVLVENQDEKQIRPAEGEPAGGFDVPIPEPGEHAAEFDVPTEFAEEDHLKLLPRLQVDIQEHRLVERR